MVGVDSCGFCRFNVSVGAVYNTQKAELSTEIYAAAQNSDGGKFKRL